MVGFAISIASFIIVAGFLIFLGMGALALIGAIFGSSSSSDNKAKGLLHPVLKILGIGEEETIHPETPEEDLKEAIKAYYEILKRVFESETPEQRKELLSSNAPSGRVSNAFYAMTGLNKAINTLTKGINYVMDGSGWVEYKKLLKDSTGGTLKKVGNKYEIIFNKEFYLTIEEYHGYDDTYGDEKEWRIEGYYNKKEVLSCYSPRTNDTAYTFKPDVWILDILKSAEKYSQLINEHELREATKRRESELFD
ncbi:hypothetical protein HY358_02355 [Candidatus Roizmanbacteria bacterium]|nr:hypothetical protein [Candidatus Roizmanbacteria bacterium]